MLFHIVLTIRHFSRQEQLQFDSENLDTYLVGLTKNFLVNKSLL